MIVVALALIGAIILATGALATIASGPLSVALWLQAAGVALLGVAGAVVFVGGTPVGSAVWSGLHPGVGIDPLTGFFSVVIAISAIPVLIYALEYVPKVPAARAVTGLGGGFPLAMVGVVCARDVLGFLACWELMTLFPAAAILVARPEAAVRRVNVEYLAVTHLGGTGVGDAARRARWPSGTSTRGPATAASTSSGRRWGRSTTCSDSDSRSPRHRGTPMCCWSPAR